MTDQLSTLLKRVYFDPSDAGGYGGAQRLYQREREFNNDNQLTTSRNSVKSFLEGVQAYTLHKPIRRAFERNHTYVSGIDKQWQAEVADVQ